MPILNVHGRGVNLAALLAAFLLVLACSCRAAPKTPRETLVVGIEAAPSTVDPRLVSDAYSSKISELLHDGLFRLTERLEVAPNLVASYEEVKPTLYRFRLREGVRFHDDRPLTSEDVKYTLESILDPKLPSPQRHLIEQIREIRVLGDLDFEIALKEPFAPLLSGLTLGIIPAGGERPEIGTGPFQLEKWDPNGEIVLIRNEGYFRGAPKISRLVFRVVPDDNLRVLELKNGRIDVLQNNIPPALLRSLKQEDLILQRTEGIAMSYLGMNVKSGPLQKPLVRQAIAHAIDIPAVIEFRLAQMARPATGILAPVHWAFEPMVPAYPYDPRKAMELLDQAGYLDPDGGGPASRFQMTYKTSTKKDRIGLARLIANYLRKVGIDVKVLPYEWGTFFGDVNAGNFELYSLTWVGVTEPDIYFYAFHSSQVPPAGANRGGYRSEVIDRLTAEGRRLTDREKRGEIYSEVQKELARDLPIIPLWYEDNVAVFSRRVKGLRLRPNASFEWAEEVWKE